MEQSKTLGRDRRLRNEERNKKFFEENQKGLHHLKTHTRMPVKQEMISGPCQETSFAAITWNAESNCTCQKKNRFLFR